MHNSFQKRKIESQTMVDVANLKDFLLDPGTTKQDIIIISNNLTETPGQVRLALGILSIRDSGNYKKAYDKFIKIKQEDKEKNKRSKSFR